MSETHMEQQKVDLDALEAKLAKATPGPWRRGTRNEYVVVHLDHGYIVCDEDPEDDNAERVEADTNVIIAAHNALPALIAELRELRARVAHMRRFAESMAEDGHPILMGFAYQVQAILGAHALPLPPAPEAQ